MKDVTLVVQGRLMQDTYRFYCLRTPEERKIFCTWEGNELDCGWKDPNLMAHSIKDTFIRRKRHERFSSYEYSLESAVLCAIESLELVDTEYVFMLRGDEWYSNLDAVGRAVKSDHKIYTIPAFFRRWEVSPFHASDHMFAGRTDNIRLMFQKCLVNMVLKQNDRYMGRPLSPAGMLCYGYVEAKSVGKPDKDAFKKLFGLIPLDELKYYKVSSEESGRFWYSDFDPKNDGSWEGSISSMEEL